MGPQRGAELGGVSITLPELTLSLPRIRLNGCSHFVREGHMQLDSSRAPYVENPYAAYQAALMQQAANREAEETSERKAEADTSRGAQEKEDTTRSAQETSIIPRACQPCPPCVRPGQLPAPARGGSPANLQQRLDHLERCFEQQMAATQACMEQLKQLRSAPQHSAGKEILPPPPEPLPEPGGFGQLNAAPMPDARIIGVRPVSYLQPIIQPPSLAPVQPGAFVLPPRRSAP